MSTIYTLGVRTDGNRGLSIDEDELCKLIQAECKEITSIELEKRPQPKYLGPPPSVTATNLAQARWGVILPPEPLTVYETMHRSALEKLIEHRRRQIDVKKHGLTPREFHYQHSWTIDDFLWEEGRQVQTGNMQVDIVPYYLCIVGSPERIPWDFQLNLSSEYAVGRLWFDDPSDCEHYIDKLIAYETTQDPPLNLREALFVGPQHPAPDATQYSATLLIEPLYEWIWGNTALGCSASLLLNDRPDHVASKANLLQRLRGVGLDGQPQTRPAFLFTAGHGLEHGNPSKGQPVDQGALLFQEWPGGFAIPHPNHYLSGNEISKEIELDGMLAFCFACYSAGTPLKQDWVRPTLFKKPSTIAVSPFVAHLPQRLLAQGLLTFIGHVSRAWGTSFMGVTGSSSQTGIIKEVIGELLAGKPVGHATDYMNRSWLHLTRKLDRWLTGGIKLSKEEIIATWIARNDLRGYVILGDPAAKLRMDSPD